MTQQIQTYIICCAVDVYSNLSHTGCSYRTSVVQVTRDSDGDTALASLVRDVINETCEQAIDSCLKAGNRGRLSSSVSSLEVTALCR